MNSKDFIVVGGGIAGLSVLFHLAGKGRACLLEREPVLGAHSSGRNAAIFRPLEDDTTTGRLSARSMETWDGLAEQSVLRRSGLLLVSAEQPRAEALAATARRQGLDHRLYAHEEICRIAPSLQGGEARHGVLAAGGGVLDIHAMLTALDTSARAAGAEVHTNAQVTRILIEQGKMRGIELSDSSRIAAPVVVIAAGAWSRDLGRSCGADMPLSPMRRHLVQLDQSMPFADRHPVVWRLEDEVYYRPESGGLLASPCDEKACPPSEPVAEPQALELLAAKLSRLAPSLSGAAVRRSWACLRTFAPDRELVAGADPRLEGLYWLGALGGRGMSVALAVGELVAELIAGRDHNFPEQFSPARLLR